MVRKPWYVKKPVEGFVHQKVWRIRRSLAITTDPAQRKPERTVRTSWFFSYTLSKLQHCHCLVKKLCCLRPKRARHPAHGPLTTRTKAEHPLIHATSFSKGSMINHTSTLPLAWRSDHIYNIDLAPTRKQD
jgi:hypothetical protein